MEETVVELLRAPVPCRAWENQLALFNQIAQLESSGVCIYPWIDNLKIWIGGSLGCHDQNMG